MGADFSLIVLSSQSRDDVRGVRGAVGSSTELDRDPKTDVVSSADLAQLFGIVEPPPPPAPLRTEFYTGTRRVGEQLFQPRGTTPAAPPTVTPAVSPGRIINRSVSPPGPTNPTPPPAGGPTADAGSDRPVYLASSTMSRNNFGFRPLSSAAPATANCPTPGTPG
jgi:hypothetical protein